MVVGVCIFSYHAYSREYYIRRGFLEHQRLLHEESVSQSILVLKQDLAHSWLDSCRAHRVCCRDAFAQLRMLPASVIDKLRNGAEFVYVVRIRLI